MSSAVVAMRTPVAPIRRTASTVSFVRPRTGHWSAAIATFAFGAGSADGLPERGALSDPRATAIEALDPMTVLATYDGRLYRSVDGGGTWTTIVAPAGAGDLELSPTTAGTLLLAAADGLYRSTDHGATFELVAGSPSELTSPT